MFGDIRSIAQMRSRNWPVALESLIFHDDEYVHCVSSAGATPATWIDCKQNWCVSHAWQNHERCVVYRRYFVIVLAERERPCRYS
jgi:hypothetical protein